MLRVPSAPPPVSTMTNGLAGSGLAVSTLAFALKSEKQQKYERWSGVLVWFLRRQIMQMTSSFSNFAQRSNIASKHLRLRCFVPDLMEMNEHRPHRFVFTRYSWNIYYGGAATGAMWVYISIIITQIIYCKREIVRFGSEQRAKYPR